MLMTVSIVEWQRRVDSEECPVGCGPLMEERADDPGILTCINCGAKEDYCPAACGGLLAGYADLLLVRCEECAWPGL